MIDKHNIQENILGMNNNAPFSVPDNYFEGLPIRIEERLNEDYSGTRVINMLHNRFAYAAMIAVLIAVGFLGTRYILNNNTYNGLTADEIIDAMEYFGYEFEDEMLISALGDSDVDYYPEFTDDETDQIIEYLSDDYIDLSELMIE